MHRFPSNKKQGVAAIAVNQHFGDRWAEVLDVEKCSFAIEMVESVGGVDEKDSISSGCLEQITHCENSSLASGLPSVLRRAATVLLP